MRKTRLVLIPGVKSLDTIGCLLLFLACPTIAFKGQENREVDAICKSQNLKELWLDSPWPGDTDNIGWARGYGGGNWPGNSQKQATCNALTTRSVIKSRRIEDRHVQARRDVSRDDGFGTRNIRLENNIRRDERREVNDRRADSRRDFRDSRRMADGMVSDEERRMGSTRVRENRRESRASTRSLNREIRDEREFRVLGSRTDSFNREGNDIRMRSAGRHTITNREVIDGNRNTGASVRNLNRDIRSKREVREPETRRAGFDRESTDSTMSAERRNVRSREVIDGRRVSKHSIRSLDNRSDRQIKNIESRRASITQKRVDSSEERVTSIERRNVENGHADKRANSRLATRSLEREVRSDRANRALASQRGSRSYERDERRMPEESARRADRRAMNTRDVSLSRSNSVSSINSPIRESRSDAGFKSNESRLGVRNPEQRQSVLDEGRFTEKRVVDSRRALNDRRDSSPLNQRRDVRSERETQNLDSRVRHSEWRQSLLDEQRSVERRVADNRRVLNEKRDSRSQNEHRGIGSERETRHLDSQLRDRMVYQRIRTAERQTIKNEKIIDAQRRTTQSINGETRYETEVRETDGRRAERRDGRLTDIRRYEGNRIDGRRELENRRESRLLTQSLDRRVRSNREAKETEHRRVEKDSRRAEIERRADIRREAERVNRRSTRSVEHEARSNNAQRTNQKDINENLQDSARINPQRRTATITRESQRTADDERRATDRRERDSRYARSIESVRSAEERRVDNRRRFMERRDYMTSIQSPERRIQSERERTDQRAAQDTRESRMNVADAARNHRADERRDSRIFVRSLDSQRRLSSRENMNHRTAMDRRFGGRRHIEVEGGNRNVEREDSGRVSRRVVSDERSDETLVRDVRQRRSAGSLERENRVRREREADGRDSRREMERELTRDVRNLGRSSHRTDERPIRAHRLSRSAGDVSRFDRRIQLTQAERGTRMDMRRSEREQHARYTERASLDRISRIDVDRMDTRLVRGSTRSLDLARSTLREVRSVGDARPDRQAERANVRRENRVADNRRQDVERDIRATKRISPERLSRLAADAGHAGTRRGRDGTQIRLIREIRSLDDTRKDERRIHSTQRETTRSDRRGDVENRSRILARAAPGRINRRMDSTERTTGTDRLTRYESRSQHLTRQREIQSPNDRRAVNERESRRHERREIDHENRQMRLASADIRRIDNQDSRDAEIRRISKDISLKFESIQTFPKEARRSDRQRRTADVERDMSRIVDKRRDIAFTTESHRRLTEFTDLTNKPRRSNIRERHSGKTNAMEREYHWELSNKGSDNFFESSKNQD